LCPVLLRPGDGRVDAVGDDVVDESGDLDDVNLRELLDRVVGCANTAHECEKGEQYGAEHGTPTVVLAW